MVGVIQHIEDAFAISLTAEEAEQVRTAGDLHQLVLARIGDKPVRQLATAGYVTRRALAEGLGMSRESIRPEMRLDELLPVENRAKSWTHISRNAKVRFPSLLYSRQWKDRILLASMAIATIPVIAVWWALWALDWIRGWGVLLFSMPAALAFLLVESRVDKHLMELCRNRATELPAETVGELATAVLELNPSILKSGQGNAALSSSQTVWDTIAEQIRRSGAVETARITSETAIPELLKVN